MEQKNNNIDSAAFEKYLSENEVKFIYERLPLPLPWYKRLFRKLFRKKNNWPKSIDVKWLCLKGDFTWIPDEEALKIIKVWGIKNDE